MGCARTLNACREGPEVAVGDEADASPATPPPGLLLLSEGKEEGLEKAADPLSTVPWRALLWARREHRRGARDESGEETTAAEEVTTDGGAV